MIYRSPGFFKFMPWIHVNGNVRGNMTIIVNPMKQLVYVLKLLANVTIISNIHQFCYTCSIDCLGGACLFQFGNYAI